MLIRSVFCVALLCALGGVIVHAVGALADARMHRAASAAAARAFAGATAQIRDRVAAQIQAGADPRAIALQSFDVAPTCTSSDAAHACALSADAAVTGTLTSGIGSANSATCAPLCAANVQENDSIDEGRFSARVRVTVTAADGTIYARRDRYALFRTMRVAPYAQLDGTRDATGATIAAGFAEGDDGGIPDATTANVRYVNAQTGATLDGNAWATRGWSNGDAVATGWDP